MSGSTPVYGLPYLELGDAPDIPQLGEGLAEATEAELVRIDADVAGKANQTEVDAALAHRLQLFTGSSGLKLQIATVVVAINAGQNQGFTDVVFPNAFAAAPIVFAVPNSLGATNAVFHIATDVTATGFRCHARTGGADLNGANANYTAAWAAIGV